MATIKEDFCKRMRISETEFDIKRNGDFEIEDMEQAYNFGKIDSKQELLPLLHFIIANRKNL